LGKLEYFHLQKYGQKGGASIVATGELFFNSGMLFDLATGEAINSVGAGPLVSYPGGLVQAAKGAVSGYRWIEVEQKDRRGNPQLVPGLEPLWSVPQVPAAEELIVAGTKSVIGGDRKVAIVDGEIGELTWSADVDGVVLGLATSGGRLLVSTDQGTIYCFDKEPVDRTAQVALPVEPPLPADASLVTAARSILEQANLAEGFCLDFGCGDGQLACELARVSNLQIIAIDHDLERLAAARRRAAGQGYLGSRITFLHTEELSDTGLPNLFRRSDCLSAIVVPAE
jgi:hypothetical protein